MPFLLNSRECSIFSICRILSFFNCNGEIVQEHANSYLTMHFKSSFKWNHSCTLDVLYEMTVQKTSRSQFMQENHFAVIQPDNRLVPESLNRGGVDGKRNVKWRFLRLSLSQLLYLVIDETWINCVSCSLQEECGL